jgi:hypothetical protein
MLSLKEIKQLKKRDFVKVVEVIYPYQPFLINNIYEVNDIHYLYNDDDSYNAIYIEIIINKNVYLNIYPSCLEKI